MNNLKFYRRKKEYTQKQVAKELNITPATYCRYETGILQPDPSALLKLSHIFHITIDELIGNNVVISTEISSALGENLTKFRKGLGLTQEEVSKRLNIARGTYAHYELGRREPDNSTLILLAKFYSKTPSELLGFEDNLKANETQIDLKKIFESNAQIVLNGQVLSKMDRKKMLRILEAFCCE